MWVQYPLPVNCFESLFKTPRPGKKKRGSTLFLPIPLKMWIPVGKQTEEGKQISYDENYLWSL